MTRSTTQWVTALEAVGVPCGPINSIDQVFADPQVRARAMQIELPHADAGTVPLVANPLHLSASPVRYATAPPLLGAATRGVLDSVLGLSRVQIEALSDGGVIQTD